MAETFGERFQRLRKERGLTQDRIAEAVNVSSQAVSKWENDINMPDIALLLPLSELLGVTTDELLGKEKHEVMIIDDPNKKKDLMKMMFRVKVNTVEGDKVNIQLPMALIKIAIDSGMSMPQVSGKVDLTQFDWKQILDLVEQPFSRWSIQIAASGVSIYGYTAERCACGIRWPWPGEKS